MLSSRRMRPLLLAISAVSVQTALAQFNYSLTGTLRDVGVLDDHLSAPFLGPWSMSLAGNSSAPGEPSRANQQSLLDPYQIKADGAVWAAMDPYHDNNRAYSEVQARFSLAESHFYHIAWNFTGTSVDADNRTLLRASFTPLGDLLGIGSSGDLTGVVGPGVYDVLALCVAFNKNYPAGRVEAAFSFSLDVTPVPAPEPTSLLGAVAALVVLKRPRGNHMTWRNQMV